MHDLKFDKDCRPYGLVYLIRNLVNGKIYVGQTRGTHKKRWRDHVEYAKKGKTWFSEAIRTFGKKAFSIDVLSYGYSQEHLDVLEGYYISLYNTVDPEIGYNMRCWGFSRTPEQMSEAGKKQLGELNHCYRHDVDTEEIIALYQSGLSISKISQKLKISTGAVAKRLRKSDVGIIVKPGKVAVDEDFLCSVYQSGMSLSLTARMFGISSDAMRGILQKNSVKVRSVNGPSSSRSHWHYDIRLDTEEILRLKSLGKTYAEVAEILGTTRGKVEARIWNSRTSAKKNRPKVAAFSGSNNGNFRNDIPTQDIINKYLAGMSLRRIAEEYKTGKTTITKRLQNAGIVLRNSQEAQLIRQAA